MPPCPARQPVRIGPCCSAAASGDALALGEQRRQLVVDGRVARRRRARRSSAGRGVQALCPQLLLIDMDSIGSAFTALAKACLVCNLSTDQHRLGGNIMPLCVQDWPATR